MDNPSDSMDVNEEETVVSDKHIFVQFKSENGEVLGSPFDMPTNLSKEKLQILCDALLQKVGRYFSTELFVLRPSSCLFTH